MLNLDTCVSLTLLEFQHLLGELAHLGYLSLFQCFVQEVTTILYKQIRDRLQRVLRN